MEEIDLFDKYISDSMSEADKNRFNERLQSDEAFAAAFRTYLITVRGICREAQEHDIEFGYAMKSMSKERLKAIIGKGEEKPKRMRRRFLRERVMWLSGVAAILIVAAGACWHLFTIQQNRLCDVVYENAYQPLYESRGDGEEYLDLNTLTLDRIEAEIPTLKSAFEADEINTQNWHIDGFTLAMAYLKLHRKQDALAVLEQLAEGSGNQEEYVKLIRQLK
ncbi:MAG: hypothetical protein K2I37_07970 [Muribaculaceae bacterium]|nr:hypothetical protein [Muribaculaceae bacterium]